MNIKKFFKHCGLFLLLNTFWLSVYAANLSLFIEPFDNGNNIINLINRAQNSIDIEVYLLNNSRIISAIENAQKRGVTVRIILERHPYGQDDIHNENLTTVNHLGSENFPVNTAIHWSNSAIFNYTHEKAIVIDYGTPEAAALILSLNLTEDATSKNRDYGIIDTNLKDIQEIEFIFNMDFCKSSLLLTYNVGFNSSLLSCKTIPIPAINETASSNLIWSPSRIIPTNNSREGLLNLINSAKNSIFIEGEELNDYAIEEALQNLAKENPKLQIKIILPKDQDSKIYLKSLPNLQVHCLIADQNNGTPLMHAKMIIVDNSKAYVGSINYSAGSMDMNRELGIIFSDQALIEQLNSQFQFDWQHYDGNNCTFAERDSSENNYAALIIGAAVVGTAAIAVSSQDK